jgi:hypothetical protein
MGYAACGARSRIAPLELCFRVRVGASATRGRREDRDQPPAVEDLVVLVLLDPEARPLVLTEDVADVLACHCPLRFAGMGIA